MKTFIGALVTFILLAVIVIINGIYIKKQTDALLEVTNLFPAQIESDDDFDMLAEEFIIVWQKCRFIICLSVSHAEAELIDEVFSTVITRWNSKDQAEYAASCVALINEIKELQKSESLTLEGIL